jgi:glycosyltransferase involved in cell wall biosynthesis
MNKPWLSIIIPTYNGENYLTLTLNSIVSQNQSDIECIVIDDGSTDSTLSIVNSFKSKLSIKLISQQRIGNWVANTNIGLREATGDYACFLHQDDLWLNDRLSIMKPLVEKFPDVCLFLHPSIFIDSNGNNLGLWQCPLPHFPLLIEPNVFLERLLVQNFISIPAPIFKRELALAVGSMKTDLWYTADWDFWLKMAAMGKAVYYPKPLSAFRVHSGSQTIRRSLELDDFRKQMEIVLEKHLNILPATDHLKLSTRNIAYFSIALNTALASKVHGKNLNYFKLLKDFLALGVLGWYKYWRYSRIWERMSARIKALI